MNTYTQTKRNKQYTQKIRKIWSSIVKPVLGTLINFMNIRKINSRGMKQDNKHIMMAALSYNLKKYLKFDRKLKRSIAKALEHCERNYKIYKTDFWGLILSSYKPPKV